jgi:hypothetical protein
MRRLLYHAGQAKPVLLPFAVIGGFLAAYGWYLFIVAVILPVIAEMGGAD